MKLAAAKTVLPFLCVVCVGASDVPIVSSRHVVVGEYSSKRTNDADTRLYYYYTNVVSPGGTYSPSEMLVWVYTNCLPDPAILTNKNALVVCDEKVKVVLSARSVPVYALFMGDGTRYLAEGTTAGVESLNRLCVSDAENSATQEQAKQIALNYVGKKIQTNSTASIVSARRTFHDWGWDIRISIKSTSRDSFIYVTVSDRGRVLEEQLDF